MHNLARLHKSAFKDLAPGSLKRYCKYDEDENCHLGDNCCPFMHKGREIAQEELAVKEEQELKSAASSSASS